MPDGVRLLVEHAKTNNSTNCRHARKKTAENAKQYRIEIEYACRITNLIAISGDSRSEKSAS